VLRIRRSQYVTGTLRQGLHGWQVTDCTVSLARSAYSVPDGPRLSAARSAARRTSANSPRFVVIEAPADTLSVLLQALAKLQAAPGAQTIMDSVVTLEGDSRAAQVHELRTSDNPLNREEYLRRVTRPRMA